MKPWEQIALDLRKDKKKQILVSLTPGQKYWLETESEQTGQSMSAIVRALINEKMEKGGR